MFPGEFDAIPVIFFGRSQSASGPGTGILMPCGETVEGSVATRGDAGAVLLPQALNALPVRSALSTMQQRFRGVWRIRAPLPARPMGHRRGRHSSVTSPEKLLAGVTAKTRIAPVRLDL